MIYALTKKLAVLAIAVCAVFSFTAIGFAQKTTDRMSCAAAQKQFATNGRVYVRNKENQKVPLYNGVSRDKMNRLTCRSNTPLNINMVPTKDNPSCPVSYYCSGK